MMLMIASTLLIITSFFIYFFLKLFTYIKLSRFNANEFLIPSGVLALVGSALSSGVILQGTGLSPPAASG